MVLLLGAPRVAWAAEFSSSNEVDAVQPDPSADVAVEDEASSETLDEASPELDNLEDDLDLGGDLESLLAEEVVSGASRSAESATEAPATTVSITGTQLYAYGIHTLSEAVNYLSLGMYAERADSSTRDTIGGRGLNFPGDNGSHVLVVLDGHFLNAPGNAVVFPDEVGNLPVELIDRIELILGPGSVLYGSNAMLGVVNIVTKRGDAVEGFRVMADLGGQPPQDESGRLAKMDADAWGREVRLGLRYGKGFHLGKQAGSFVMQGTFLDDRSIAFPYHPQYLEGLEELSNYGPNTRGGDPRIWAGRWQARSQSGQIYSRLNLGGFQLTARSQNAGWTNPEITTQFNDQDAESFVSTNSLDARYSFEIGTKVGGMVRGYADYMRSSSDVLLRGDLACVNRAAPVSPCRIRSAAEGYRGGGEMQWTFDWFADGRFSTLVGGDVHYDGYRARLNPEDYVRGTKFGTVGVVDIGQLAWAAYAQQVIRPARAKWFGFNAGVRFDQVASNWAVSPRAAAVFKPWKDGVVKAVYSQAFRAPTAAELGTSFPGERLQADDLDPERVQGVELIVGHKVRAHKLTLGGFGTRWRDMIRSSQFVDPTNPRNFLQQYRNSGEIWNAGINAGWALSKGPWDAGINVTYAYSRARISGGDDGRLSEQELEDSGYSAEAVERHGRYQPLAASPSVFGNARVAYSFGEHLPTLAQAVHFTGPRYIEDVYADRFAMMALDGGGEDRVPWRMSFRTTVSGHFKRFERLDYRLTADFATHTASTKRVGVYGAQHQGDGTMSLALYQIPRLSLWAGLAYNF